jgi:predicted DNA-binding protein with PD1-like motif
MIKEVMLDRSFVGKLGCGDDLIEALTSLCIDNGVTFGRVEAIGAVKKGRIGFYNQSTREYEFLDFDRPMEISNLIGNISIKDGKPIIHAHITLADHNGATFSGHLSTGTIVFACEYLLQSYTGTPFERGFDEETGLPLWEK